MIRIAALAVAAALISLPAAAHAQGKSGTAPGRSTTNPPPGHTFDPNGTHRANNKSRPTVLLSNLHLARIKTAPHEIASSTTAC